ncbi:hypothetical protein ACFE04_026162 [Oxalis oulophora]
MVYFKNTRDGCLIVARSEPTRLSQGTRLPISPSLADPKTSIPKVDKPAQHPTSWSVPILKSLQPKTDEIEDCPSRTIQLLNHIHHINTTDDAPPPSFLLRGKTGLSPSSSPLLITGEFDRVPLGDLLHGVLVLKENSILCRPGGSWASRSIDDLLYMV